MGLSVPRCVGLEVALRWVAQSGAAFTTTSRTRAHLEEDLGGVFDFELSDDDMAVLSSLVADAPPLP